MRLALVTAAVAVLLLPEAAVASPSVRYGIQDDAWLAYGPGSVAGRVRMLDRLGVDVVRFTIHWDRAEPARGRFDWSVPDSVLHALRARGIRPLITLVGTPRWANGGRPANVAPQRGADFARFAATAAARYPWVLDWSIWNEPNQVRFLRPASPQTYVTRLLNPAYAAIHRRIRGARVAGGETAPRGNVGGRSPVAWIRGMRARGALLDAYAHHPYATNRLETPFAGGCAHCATVTMATLERLLREVGRAWPGKRVWLTEYGYQTNPPDRLLGVSHDAQARYLGDAALRVYRAPLVDLLIQFLVRDEAELGRFQSGLYTASGAAKPAAAAFQLPLASSGGGTVWGQVRPRSGRQPYRLQLVRRDGSTAWLGATRRTDARGFLAARAGRGTTVRLYSPRDRAFGVPVLVR
ncbi:MAG TPA: beta-galactosidase [Gaiellaceae bacterium]|nr:beta-galactosidase [Gaiellaceae bacterium]